MQEDESLGGVIAKLTGGMPLLSLVQSIQVPTVQSGYDRIAEVREDVPEVEGELTACLKKVVRQRTEIAH